MTRPNGKGGRASYLMVLIRQISKGKSGSPEVPTDHQRRHESEVKVHDRQKNALEERSRNPTAPFAFIVLKRSNQRGKCVTKSPNEPHMQKSFSLHWHHLLDLNSPQCCKHKTSRRRHDDKKHRFTCQRASPLRHSKQIFLQSQRHHENRLSSSKDESFGKTAPAINKTLIKKYTRA